MRGRWNFIVSQTQSLPLRKSKLEKIVILELLELAVQWESTRTISKHIKARTAEMAIMLKTSGSVNQPNFLISCQKKNRKKILVTPELTFTHSFPRILLAKTVHFSEVSLRTPIYLLFCQKLHPIKAASFCVLLLVSTSWGTPYFLNKMRKRGGMSKSNMEGQDKRKSKGDYNND